LLGRSFGAENVFSFQICNSFRTATFYVDVAFIIMIVVVYKMEAIRLNITCQFISLFAMKGRNKERNQANSAILAFVNRHFRMLSFEYVSVRVVGTCRCTECTVQITKDV
jgi:hypothetical protein